MALPVTCVHVLPSSPEISRTPPSQQPPPVALSSSWRFQNCRLSGSWSAGRVTAGETRRWSETEATSAAKTALPPEGEPAGAEPLIVQLDEPAPMLVVKPPSPPLKSSDSRLTGSWSTPQSPGAAIVRNEYTAEDAPLPQALLAVTRQ